MLLLRLLPSKIYFLTALPCCLEHTAMSYTKQQGIRCILLFASISVLVFFSNLAIVDNVIVDILADAADLQQNLCYDFLFLLFQHGTEMATLNQQMEVGIAALKRWQQHCSISGNYVELNNIHGNSYYGYSNSEDIAILGCLRLAALAVRIDNDVLVARDTHLQATECNKMQAVTDLITVLLQDWIDPVIATVFLIEVRIIEY